MYENGVGVEGAVGGEEDDDKHAMIYDLVQDYLDTEMIHFYRESFIETAVESVLRMMEASTDGAVGVGEDGCTTIRHILEETLQERAIPQREKSLFLSRSLCQDSSYVEHNIKRLDAIQQPDQRTAEWYELRRDLLTATAVSSIFGSPSKFNEVVYEKCRKEAPSSMRIELTDPRHWGIKYEPLTRTIYEHMFKTKVKEYGCIRHPSIPFLGASPDGINIDPRNRAKYGRLLEIKNVVSREITGVPLDAYWIQMQVQMEVCNLDVCDFVETSIKEFDGEAEFMEKRDQYDYCGAVLQLCRDEEGVPSSSNVEYLFSPLSKSFLWNSKQFEKWSQNVWKHKKDVGSATQRIVAMKYWYLDEFSCVVVERNKAWFETALPKIGATWELIEKERENGEWKKRAPASKKIQMDLTSLRALSTL